MEPNSASSGCNDPPSTSRAAAPPPRKLRLAEFGLRHGLTSDTKTPVMRKDELMLRTGLMFGSEFFVDTQLPGPNALKYTAVRVLPPSPLRHVTHADPFAL